MIPIYGPDDLRPHLDIVDLIASAKQAFRAISNHTAHTPVYVLHPNELADIHVKSAVLPDCPIFTVKMAGWSQVLVDRGEPPSSGMIAVFDNETCKPLAILQDDHLISDYRTAAAGALVAQLFAPRNARSALIVGTGVQARLQAEALLLILPIERIEIWGRNDDNANALTTELSSCFTNCRFNMTVDLACSVHEADVIVTATGAKEPIIQEDWLRLGQHLTSVGSDDASKCEIAPKAFASAQVFVDAIATAKDYGSTHRAINEGLLDYAHLTELGSLVDGKFTRDPQQTTIACLSGLGIQDLTAVNQFWGALNSQSKHL